jgi:hypothetical protein
MVLRYSDAILAYATALLRRGHSGSPEDAEDVHMAVVQNMLEGKLSRQEASGRFRFFVQRAVRNAVSNYQRGRSRKQARLQRLWDALRGKRPGEPAAPPADAALEEADRVNWHEKVLDRAMKALEDYERRHQDRTHPNVYHTLATLLIGHPADSSEELARRLSGQVGREYSANCTRQIVLRLRMKLAELLVIEVSHLLDDPTYENVLDELSELGLLAYVGPYLAPTGHPAGGA